jgi:hypothetical protein
MTDNEIDADEGMFFTVDEKPQAPNQPMPRPTKVVPPDKEAVVLQEKDETNEEDDESYVEIVEPFNTTNDYVFSLTLVQDDEGEKFAAVQMDNCTIELPLVDVLEMIGHFSTAIPKLIEATQQRKG